MIRLFEGADHAELYRKYRLSTPKSVVDTILQWMQPQLPEGTSDHATSDRKYAAAVDVGCGSGQHTLPFAPYFEKVYGFDVSQAQIAEAQRHLSDAPGNVIFQVSPAEHLPLPDRSVQLITGCCSFHWFDLKQFYEEVDRVLVPGGVVAITSNFEWSVFHESKSEELSCLKEKFITNVLLEGRHPCLNYSNNRYETLPLPYAEVRRVYDLPVEFYGTLADVVGSFKTWTSYQDIYKRDPERMDAAIDEFRQDFLRILGQDLGTPSEDVSVLLRYDYFVIMCRKPFPVLSK